MVVLEGKTRVAQYCQWDGYPAGQGATILSFLKNWNRDTFVTNLRKTSFVDKQYVRGLWKALGADDSGFVSIEISNKMKKEHPQFQQDLGADVLELIQSGKIDKLNNDEEFAADSLFCEWVYVIDLDKNVLEVYKGFNKKPINESNRFFYLNGKETWHDKTDEKPKEYYPVRLAKSYPLNNLPTQEQLNRLEK